MGGKYPQYAADIIIHGRLQTSIRLGILNLLVDGFLQMNILHIGVNQNKITNFLNAEAMHYKIIKHITLHVCQKKKK